MHPRNGNRREPTRHGNSEHQLTAWMMRRRHFVDASIEFGRAREQSGFTLPGFDLRPPSFLYFRNTGIAAGAFATHIDDILGCGEPDALPRIREFSERRFGE